jgi:two-component system, NtrC family, response regulator PilR
MILVPRILVVDDEAAVRDFFQAVLHEHGFTITSTATGRHALSLLADSEFELTILDMSLEDMDGLELIRRVHADFPFSKIAAVSGYMGGVLEREAISAGADVTLSKPTSRMQLRNAVCRVLAHSIRPLSTVQPSASQVRQCGWRGRPGYSPYSRPMALR